MISCASDLENDQLQHNEGCCTASDISIIEPVTLSTMNPNENSEDLSLTDDVKLLQSMNITCPICNYPQYSIDDLSQATQVTAAKNDGLTCVGNCGKEAVIRCQGCQHDAYCDSCYTSSHQHPIFQRHQRTAIVKGTSAGQLQNANAKKCHEHDEPISVICLPCMELSCHICASIGKHKDHKSFMQLKQLTTWSKEDIESWRENLRARLSMVESSIVTVQHELLKVKQNHMSLNEKITKTFQELHDMLNERELELIKSSNDMERVKTFKLEKQENNLMDVMKFVGKLLEVGDSQLSRVNQADYIFQLMKLQSLIENDMQLELSVTSFVHMTFKTNSLALQIKQLGSHVQPTLPRKPMTPVIDVINNQTINLSWTYPQSSSGIHELLPIESYVIQMRQEPLIESTTTTINQSPLTDWNVLRTMTTNKADIPIVDLCQISPSSSTSNISSSTAINQQLVKYHFRVCAVNQMGKGEYSDAVTYVPSRSEFKYSGRDYDCLGILYWIGTNCGRQKWVNPVQLGAVKVTCSSKGFGNVEDITANHVGRFYTNNLVGSWVEVELMNGWLINPSHYTIGFFVGGKGNIPRNWVLEAVPFGAKTDDWKVLKKHKKDMTLSESHISHTFVISASGTPTTSNPVYYYKFRLRQKGKTSSESDFFVVSGLEFYGRLVNRSL